MWDRREGLDVQVCALTGVIFRRIPLTAVVHADRKVGLPEVPKLSGLLPAASVHIVSVTISDTGTDCHLLSTSVLRVPPAL